MGIDYKGLAHGPNNFRDGLEFFEDIRAWATTYEQEHMVPNKWNHQLAEETSRILMADVPDILKPVAKQVVLTMMDDRLRRAMMCVAALPKLAESRH